MAAADKYPALAKSLVPEKYREIVANSERIMENAVDKRKLTNARKLWTIADFDEGYLIGVGGYGKVYIAREKTSGLIVALKHMNLNKLHDDFCRTKKLTHVEIATNRWKRQTILREIEIQSRLHHPNILQMYNYIQGEVDMIMIMELATYGDLRGIMERSRPSRIDEDLAKKIIYQIATALLFMHKSHIIHRDLKPDNVLLDAGLNVKLADYGLSVKGKRRASCAGTPGYMAPEIILFDLGRTTVKYSEVVDNWSLGVISCELVLGRLPFDFDESLPTANQMRQQRRDVLYKELAFSKEEVCQLQPEGLEFLQGLLNKNPYVRMNLQTVLNHPWLINALRGKPYARRLMKNLSFLIDDE